ncbi:MAG: YdiU family protein [Microcoleaceae cyanobacterium]
MTNPFLFLDYEPAFEQLGENYYDIVSAAEFPLHRLRFRNDALLPILGINPEEASDEHFIEAFGQFESVRPFLAMAYHGHQFGEYNPYLGDGRGFLYGQVRGVEGDLYDLGTKGSGRTPYSRSADGRLTLKGGVREVLAAEMLHRLGVRTSRCLSLIETGEQLWRGDEPSPTRSAVMVRLSRSHIRFGTFERLYYFKRPDLMQKLLDHVITYYYPHLLDERVGGDTTPVLPRERYLHFYQELIQRVAKLAAQWMAVGFCHGVLNTDNMSITGESFDYGPYAFLPEYNPRFTAAYFDYGGRYAYSNQPFVCQGNLEILQRCLSLVMDWDKMNLELESFQEYYQQAYRTQMIHQLGFDQLPVSEGEELVKLTLNILKHYDIGYHQFFITLRQQFSPQWQHDPNQIFLGVEALLKFDDWRQLYVQEWRQLYHHYLQTLSPLELEEVQQRLQRYHPTVTLVRSQIEAVWEPIVIEDNWQPFEQLLQQIRAE